MDLPAGSGFAMDLPGYRWIFGFEDGLRLLPVHVARVRTAGVAWPRKIRPCLMRHDIYRDGLRLEAGGQPMIDGDFDYIKSVMFYSSSNKVNLSRGVTE